MMGKGKTPYTNMRWMGSDELFFSHPLYPPQTVSTWNIDVTNA